MKTMRLLVILAVAMMAGTSSTAALAQASFVAQSTAARTPTSSATSSAESDAERYATREASDRSVADFEGGNAGWYIGSGAVVVVLLIVLLVVLL